MHLLVRYGLTQFLEQYQKLFLKHEKNMEATFREGTIDVFLMHDLRAMYRRTLE